MIAETFKQNRRKILRVVNTSNNACRRCVSHQKTIALHLNTSARLDRNKKMPGLVNFRNKTVEEISRGEGLFSLETQPRNNHPAIVVAAANAEDLCELVVAERTRR